MKATHEDLDLLLALTIGDLKRKLEAGEATAADLNVARQLLKDNGVGLVPIKRDELGALRDALPFPSGEEVASEAEYFN